MLLNCVDLFCDSDVSVALLTSFLLFAFGKSPRVFFGLYVGFVYSFVCLTQLRLDEEFL